MNAQILTWKHLHISCNQACCLWFWSAKENWLNTSFLWITVSNLTMTERGFQIWVFIYLELKGSENLPLPTLRKMEGREKQLTKPSVRVAISLLNMLPINGNWSHLLTVYWRISPFTYWPWFLWALKSNLPSENFQAVIFDSLSCIHS